MSQLPKMVLKDMGWGKLAEIVAFDAFKKAGYKVKWSHEKGHDFIILDTKEKVEVKIDSKIQKTNRFPMEWFHNKEKQEAGWIQYSDADILVYFFDFKNALVLDMKRLKHYIKENKDELEKRGLGYSVWNSKAYNYCIPKEELKPFIVKKYQPLFEYKYDIENSNQTRLTD